MKQRQFFSGLSWLIFLNLLVKPAWIFFIDRQVQNVVGLEAYGHYFALLNLSYVLLFVADAGLSNLMVQQVAGHPSRSPRQFLNFKWMLLLSYILLNCFIGWLIGIRDWALFIPIILVQVFGSLFLFLRSLLSANQLFKTDAVFSIADKGLMILFCFPFLYGWWQPITLSIFLQLQLFALMVINSLLLLNLFRKKSLPSNTSKKHTITLRKLFPFSLVILLMGMHYRLDGFLLERLHPNGALQAGIYALAYRLLDAANMVGFLTASFLIAFVARNQNDKQLLQHTLNLSRLGLMAIALVCSCFAVVFPTFLQDLLYHTDDVYIDRVIQLTLAVLPAYYLVHIYGTVLTALEALPAFIRVLLTSVILNVVLNLVLVPHYGAAGSAIAALASQYGCAAMCYFAAMRKLGLSLAIRPWLFYTAAAFCLLVLLSAMKLVIHSVWIILAVSGLLLIILTLWQRKRLAATIRSFI